MTHPRHCTTRRTPSQEGSFSGELIVSNACGNNTGHRPNLFAMFVKQMRIIGLLLLCFIYANCSNNRKQNGSQLQRFQLSNNASKTIPSKGHEKPNSSPEDFEIFFKSFQTDSVFQKSRVEFPLKYIVPGDDGENDAIAFIKASKLHFFGLFILNKDKAIVKKIKPSAGKIKIQFQISDTGFEKDFLFITKKSFYYKL